MAKIRNANPKSSSGGYTRVFNDENLGKLIQKIQSTVISNGTELEKYISEKSNLIANLDDFLSNRKDEQCNGAFLCTKAVIKKSKYKLDKHEPDLIVFEINSSEKNCYIIELKDGDNFDTKKSDGEFENLEKYKNHLGSKIPFVTNFFICCFNQESKDLIVKGFKNRFSVEQVMTGKQLCNLLGIDYDTIIETRKKDAEDNVDYFTDQLIKIPLINSKIFSIKNSHIEENDFYNNDEM